MKIKYFLIIGLMLYGSAFWFGKILAQSANNTSEISFPVAELNNCKDKTDCRSYCDIPQNIEACINFAEKNNLMPTKEVQLAKKFIATGATGPGGCQGKKACEAYCDNVEHIDECVDFAEKNDLMPPKELAEAKQIQAALKRGVKLPNCNSKQSCDAYCETPEHMEECVAFGIEAGFIQGKELEDAQKMVVAVKKGVRPPPCRGKEACDAYCSEPKNMEVCMNFAIEAGFMNAEEAAKSQKMLVAIKKGVKPPQCRGKEECDTYCSSEEHFEECANFAEAAGFMSAEEAAMSRKTKGKTPGGCKGKEACEAFCNNPDNQQTCFNFSKENGLMSEEEIKKMGEGKQQFKGPGGCTSPEECRTYCESHPQECQQFVPPQPPPDNQLSPPNEQLPQNGQFQPPTDGQYPPNSIPYDKQRVIEEFQVLSGVNCASLEECQQIIQEQAIKQEQMIKQYTQQLPPPDGQFQPPTDAQYPPPPDQTYQVPSPSEPTFAPDTPYQQ